MQCHELINLFKDLKLQGGMAEAKLVRIGDAVILLDFYGLDQEF